MGQAAVETSQIQPEAVSSAAASDAASADDLLSQIAGEEIDRLLAEADAKQTGEPTAAPELDAAAASTSPASAAEVPESTVPPPQSAADLNTVLTAAAVPPAPVVSNAVESAPPPAEPAAVQPAERAALESPEQTIKAMQELTDAAGAQRGPSILLKPLEWISAPLLACPERVRELLGKIAIITLVNAIAVFVYVLLFRRH